MKTDTTIVSFPHPDAFDDPLTSVLREGARRLLAQASASYGSHPRISGLPGQSFGRGSALAGRDHTSCCR